MNEEIERERERSSVVANDDVFVVHDVLRSMDLGFSLSWGEDVAY